MSDSNRVFTVDTEMIKVGGTSPDVLYRVLFSFARDRDTLHIALDRQGSESQVLVRYHDLALRYRDIALWWQMLFAVRGASGFRYVSVPPADYGDAELFLTVCSRTPGERTLLSGDTRMYLPLRSFAEEHGIRILGKAEAIRELSAKSG